MKTENPHNIKIQILMLKLVKESGWDKSNLSIALRLIEQTAVVE